MSILRCSCWCLSSRNNEEAFPVSFNVLTNNLSHTFLTFLACLLGFTHRFGQLQGGYEQMTATTWRRGNAMPYFHDNVASALLGCANGLIWAAREWECAQLGPFSVLLQDYTAVYALRSFVRVERLQINFLCLASDTRGPLLFLVIVECLCTKQAVFFAIICSLWYCTVEAVNARTTPQNFRFCDFAARDIYGHAKLQNSS